MERPDRPGTAALGAAMLAMAASGPGQSFGLAPFTDPLIASADVSRSVFSLLYGVATVCSALLALAAGRALDRLGARTTWTMAVGGLGLALLGMSLDAGVLVLAPTLCAARALGQGTLPLLATVVVARSFTARRGPAMAFAAQGFTVSGIGLPLLATALIDGVGWQATLRVFAAALLLVVLPLGLALLSAADARSPGTASPGDHAPPRPPGALMLAVTLATPALITTGLVVHATAIAADAGSGVAAAAIAAVAVGSATGVIGGGLVADRWPPGRLLLLVAGSVTAGSLVLLLGGVMLIFGFAACGASGGVVISANVTLWARLYGTTGLGRLQGLSSGATIAGAALGPSIPAASLALTGSFRAGIIVMAGLGVLSWLLGLHWVRATAARSA